MPMKITIQIPKQEIIDAIANNDESIIYKIEHKIIDQLEFRVIEAMIKEINMKGG